MTPRDRDSTTSLAAQFPAEIVGALTYLDQTFADGREFAVLIGDQAESAAAAVRRFLAAHEHELRGLQLPAPISSAHTFLQTLLVELGFDPIESTVDELQRLLLVVFRQAQTDSKRSVVLISQAHELGPRAFEALRELSNNLATLSSMPLFILTGTSALARVLDSRGMASIAHRTQLRFDFGRRTQAEADECPASLSTIQSTKNSTAMGHASLTIMIGDRLIDCVNAGAERLLIGRGVHNDVILPGRYVSRHHAMIVLRPEGLTLLDLKSTNGTLVNSRAIHARILQDGDWLSIGNYRLRFSDNRSATSRPIPHFTDPRELAETHVMRSIRGIGPDATDEPGGDSRENLA